MNNQPEPWQCRSHHNAKRRGETMPTQINERALTWVPEDQIEPKALTQIHNISKMPFIFRHVAVMPDCHFGLGATVGSCIPTRGAIIPAAVGVDIAAG